MPSKGTELARSALALALAALTGCYHLQSTSVRTPRDQAQQVERRPDGSHLELALQDGSAGALVVVAEEQAMCRAEERGTRTWEVTTTVTRRKGAHPMADFGSGCGLPCLPIGLVLLPVFVVLSIAAAVAPDQSVSVGPADEPPEHYVKWQAERSACGASGQRVSQLPLRLQLPRGSTGCAAWAARTGQDGTAVLAETLATAAWTAEPCRGRSEPGVLLITVEGLSDGGEPAGRTTGELAVPLSPAQAAALGVEPSPRQQGPGP